MTMKLTKKGARQVAKSLDKVAALFQDDHVTLGIDPKIANDFARRCDILSDYVEKQAGFSSRVQADFNPEEIGIEKSGPLEMIDSDEPFMNGEFTQQENRELCYDQQNGKLGPDKTTLDPQTIPAGKQAGFEVIGRQETINKMSKMNETLHSTALKLAGYNQSILADGVTKLAQAVMDTQVGISLGTVTASQSAEIMDSFERVMPYIAAVSPQTQSKVAQMIDLALHVAKKSDEDEKDEKKDDDKKEDSGKSFFEKMEEAKAKKKAKKSDDDEEVIEEEDNDSDEEVEGKKKSAKKSEDEEDGDDEEVEGKKKASHGFTLNAK